jgi:hypothetical protein
MVWSECMDGWMDQLYLKHTIIFSTNAGFQKRCEVCTTMICKNIIKPPPPPPPPTNYLWCMFITDFINYINILTKYKTSVTPKIDNIFIFIYKYLYLYFKNINIMNLLTNSTRN